MLDYFRRKDSIDSKEIVSLVFVMGLNTKEQEVVGQAYLQNGTSNSSIQLSHWRNIT